MSIKSSAAVNRGRATIGQTRADAALGSLMKHVLASRPSGKKVLVIDVDGTSVKILASGQTEIRSFRSGPTLTPVRMVSGVKKLAADGGAFVISPGPLIRSTGRGGSWTWLRTLRCPSEKQRRHFARSSFLSREKPS